ncbi:bifunctional endo-1,4-beta-xylanase XylA-like [Tripterygium wilfordii]|uniref:bifunctional endo-1,4-beta-xylanase XylA-like n=1 Tax=Tripterygium wilfordii TaxID=458696 RepID=UPI0018F82E9C|nr:bifunctional endo-1,4-beta-xylanase XylA-like [Tripterygium wilfordii]
MGGWRKQRGENHHQEVHGRRWQNRKPPLGTWHPTVASWEKKFCASVGSVSWRKLIEAQRFTYIYKNVINWDDSAVEEAFNSAKSRFWAQINGLPCDISLPDPDMYIEEIDWDSIINPELILDSEREPKVCDQTDNGEHVIIFGDSFLQEHYSIVPVIGWGPEETFPKPTNDESDRQLGNDNQNVDGNDDLLEKIDNESKKNVDRGTGWGLSWSGSLEQNRPVNNGDLLNNNCNESKKNVDRGTGWGLGRSDSWEQNRLENKGDLLNKNNNESKNVDHGTGWGLSWSGSWEQNWLENNSDLLNKNSNESKNVDHGEWGYVWNDPWGQNQLENNGDMWNKNYNEPKNMGHGTGRDWGMWDRDRKKREGTGWNMSRYETSRYHGNYYSTDHGWRNGRWQKKLNFAYEQPNSNQVPHSNQYWTEVNYNGPVNQSNHWESRNPMQF